MKWFKKLCREKSAKSTEEMKPTKLDKNENFTGFVPAHAACSDVVNVLDEPATISMPDGVFMLTTMKNFRLNDLEEFSFESEWIIVNRVDLSEPKFQECLRKTETLTELCRSLAKTSLNKRSSKVVAKSPTCLCDKLSSSGNDKLLRLSVCRRIAYSFKKMCRNLSLKLKFWKKSKPKCTSLYSKWMNTVEEPKYYIPTSTYLAEGRMPCDQTVPRVGAALRAYVLHLAQDKRTTIAKTIAHFIACMQNETCPQVMMRNMRRFMSGMKNHLMNYGEKEFENEIEKERRKLKPSEFLYLDAILEGVMHKLVVQPLQPRLYSLLCSLRSDDVRTLQTAIERAQHVTALQLGIKDPRMVPSATVLAVVSRNFQLMQNAYSPLDKLQKLLASISVMFKDVRGEEPISADDLLPVLAWCLARCRLVRVEIEAALMSGLLPETLVASGESSYYIMSLFSAIDVLKRLASSNLPPSTIQPKQKRRRSLTTLSSSSTSSEAVAMVRVVQKNQCRGSLKRKPVSCQTGARVHDLCHALAHAANIKNPQDYGLFALYDGHEIMLNHYDCPQDLMSEKSGKNFTLAYRRIDEKMFWPQQALLSYP